MPFRVMGYLPRRTADKGGTNPRERTISKAGREPPSKIFDIEQRRDYRTWSFSCKGLSESYVGGTTHAHAWVTWGPLTFRHLRTRGSICMRLPLEPGSAPLSVTE